MYTSADSIVFGGNFLHSFAIEKQLQVAHIEDVTHVPSKFRFPFFTELLWHALDRYVRKRQRLARLGCVDSSPLPQGGKRRDSRNLAFIFSCISVLSLRRGRLLSSVRETTNLYSPILYDMSLPL